MTLELVLKKSEVGLKKNGVFRNAKIESTYQNCYLCNFEGEYGLVSKNSLLLAYTIKKSERKFLERVGIKYSLYPNNKNDICYRITPVATSNALFLGRRFKLTNRSDLCLADKSLILSQNLCVSVDNIFLLSYESLN